MRAHIRLERDTVHQTVALDSRPLLDGEDGAMSAAHGDRSADPSTGDYLGEWLIHVKGRVRHRTWKGYEGLIRLYAAPTLGDRPLDELTSLDVLRLYGVPQGRGSDLVGSSGPTRRGARRNE